MHFIGQNDSTNLNKRPLFDFNHKIFTYWLYASHHPFRIFRLHSIYIDIYQWLMGAVKSSLCTSHLKFSLKWKSRFWHITMLEVAVDFREIFYSLSFHRMLGSICVKKDGFFIGKIHEITAFEFPPFLVPKKIFKIDKNKSIFMFMIFWCENKPLMQRT